jgi:hypothetical protein
VNAAGHFLWILFGPSTWGAGGNMVAWVICGVLGFGWLHARQKALHVARMAQAARHHQDETDLANKHHQEQMDLLRKQHSQLSDQVAATPAPKRGGR